MYTTRERTSECSEDGRVTINTGVPERDCNKQLTALLFSPPRFPLVTDYVQQQTCLLKYTLSATWCQVPGHMVPGRVMDGWMDGRTGGVGDGGRGGGGVETKRNKSWGGCVCVSFECDLRLE